MACLPLFRAGARQGRREDNGWDMGRLTSLGGRGSALRLAALGLTLSLGGCLGYDGDIQHGYVTDERALAQVKTGASAEQVLVLMGTPSTTSTVGGDAWYYISQKTLQGVAFSKPEITDQKVLAIYFGKGKKVERIANYGIEDGQVFDFVSRTTPTAGSEPVFLRGLLSSLLKFKD